MARTIRVTGGSRSGKSGYAQNRAEGLPGPRLFVATCPDLDAEMVERIRRHREERAGRGWTTVEETVNLQEVLDRERKATSCVRKATKVMANSTSNPEIRRRARNRSMAHSGWAL